MLTLIKKQPSLWIMPWIVLFIYFFPRFLVNTLGPENPWTSYLYMYGLGGLVFLIGLWLILYSKACQLSRARDFFWFKVLIAGYFLFASLHGFWILLALTYPVKTGV